MKNVKLLYVPDMMAESGLEVLRARDDVEVVTFPSRLGSPELRALIAEASGVALSVTPFGAEELHAAPKLEVVARLGVGFDAVDVPALTEAGIPLMVVGTTNSTSVAEHAMFLMLAVAKRGVELDRRMRHGEWHDRARNLPRELAGSTVLIVGFGRIGTRTAPRCAAFGMHVLVYDPYVGAEAVQQAGYERVQDLDAGLARADYVTIHCPRNPETVGLFGAERLARMKRGAVLVNTARGGIIDEAALYAALESGHLSGAGLDVVETEPPPPGHKLLLRPDVISSPHMAGVTLEARTAGSRMTALNLLSVLDGAPIAENVVNQEVLSRWSARV